MLSETGAQWLLETVEDSWRLLETTGDYWCTVLYVLETVGGDINSVELGSTCPGIEADWGVNR